MERKNMQFRLSWLSVVIVRTISTELFAGLTCGRLCTTRRRLVGLPWLHSARWPSYPNGLACSSCPWSWEGLAEKTRGGKNGQTEGGNSAISIHLPSPRSRVRSARGCKQGGKPPVENKIKMYEFIHNNAFKVFTYIINASLCYNMGGPVWLELSPLGCCVAHRGLLTVDRDFDLALIRRSHSIVGNAFVVLGLLPLNLCDVQELPLTHQPIYWHKADVKGHCMSNVRWLMLLM